MAALNISDVAACGGVPVALLFNCAMPSNFRVPKLVEIAVGMKDLAASVGVVIGGGDISSSLEMSLSATVMGYVERERMLRRTGARRGDTIFLTRYPGLTTAALKYCTAASRFDWLSLEQTDRSKKQFALDPEVALGRALVTSESCTSCMDNTDGLGQSLSELAAESKCKFILDGDQFPLDDLVAKSALKLGEDPVDFALGPGADFGLVGTLAGEWESDTRGRSASSHFTDRHCRGGAGGSSPQAR